MQNEAKIDGAEIAAGTIEAETVDKINVGAGGTLIVPREDIGEGIDEGTSMDIAEGLPKRIHKPGRRDWVKLNRESELTTKLLIHRPNPDSMDVEHYYVAPGIRLPIVDELRAVRVFQYYSLGSKTHGLWVVNVNPENRWYESLGILLRQPNEFFVKNVIRIVSDKEAGYYKVKYRSVDIQVKWPEATTQQLLGEALGPGRFISSVDHPVYADLVAGKELS